MKSSLHGRRIVVTRNLASAGRLTARLRELGAEVLELPLIRIEMGAEPRITADIFGELAQYEWAVFTSGNGVRGFFAEFTRVYEDIRSLGLIRFAAIGEATAAAIREWHIKVELMPENATADALGEAMRKECTLDNLRVLVVTGNRNREDLVKVLEDERAIVDVYPVYKTELADLAEDERAAEFRARGADALVFASSSAVESFGRQASHLKLAPGAQIPALCSFGPQTTETMKKARIPVAVEASEPSLEGLIAALEAHFAKQA